MSAAALERRHARSVELAVELQAIATERAELDCRDDAARARERTFLGALARWLRPLVESVPGGRRAWAFLAGVADSLATRDAIEKLDDAVGCRERAAARELAGLLDGVDLEDRMPMAVSA